jgi:hypothetical protein
MSTKKSQNSTKTVKGNTKKNEKYVEETTTAAASNNVDYSKLKKDIRAVPVKDWDWSRVIYSNPVKQDIPGGGGHYRRVRIQYLYDDETIGPAIVEFGRHYCYGVQPDNLDKDGKVVTDPETGKPKALHGYKVPIVMTSQSKTNPNAITPEEQAECDFLDAMRAEVIRYLKENKALIGKGAKSNEFFDDSFGKVLYRKENEEDGTFVEGVAPKLYTNLIYYPKNKEVGTTFYGPGDKPINPLTMTNHFYIYPNIRFDCIYIAGKMSLQHKIYDASVEPISNVPKKRLARPNTMESQEVHEYDDTGETSGPNEMMQSEDEE